MTAALLFFLTLPAWSYFDYQNTSVREMNGIKFKDFKDFPQQWQLVTVRYREDTKELRFTYANSKAAAALKHLGVHYPDGAAFGKVSYLLEADHVFPSSLVPTQVRRYQLMVKNRKRYPESDGWGYALFTDQGTTFNEDVTLKTKACVACHRIVPERDHVFSRRLQQGASSGAQTLRVSFVAKAPKDFAGPVLQLLGTGAIEAVEGPLREAVFSGTLDEIIPALIERVRQTGRSALLYVDEKNFSVVATTGTVSCEEGKGRRYKIVIHFNGGVVRDTDYCLQR